MRPADLDEVGAIERASFRVPWPQEAFAMAIGNPEISEMLVASFRERGREVVAGYLCFWFVSREIHLANIAVGKPYRRKGIASMLLETVVEAALARSATYIVLEVRSSNTVAKALYRKFGFVRAGVRRGYYENGENADILVKKL